MESLEATTSGRGSDHNPLTGLLPFLMLMGDVALLSVTLLGHGTIGHFHCGIAGKGPSRINIPRPTKHHREDHRLSLGERQVIVILTDPALIDRISPDGGRIEIRQDDRTAADVQLS